MGRLSLITCVWVTVHLLALPFLSLGQNEKKKEMEIKWICPSISPSNKITCRCDLPHTLRCDGGVEDVIYEEVLRRLLKQVGNVDSDSRITLLDISVQNITTLPPRLFEQVAIDGLVVSSGELVNISSKAFFGLERHLTALGLPRNKLRQIPVQALSILPHISRLDLSSNKISSILSLPSLKHLEFLDMSNNSIEKMAAGVLQSVPTLQTLQLGNNKLSSKALYHYNLQHLTYLSSLDLSSNNLSGLLSTPLFDLFPANLRNLDLSFNFICGIASNTFSQLTGLTTLSLQGNQIDEIQDGSFLGLISLHSLDLSHNHVLTLSTQSLAGLSSLTQLNLAHNHLQVVSSSSLSQSPLLYSLLLMDNDITTVEEGALSGLYSLIEVNMAGNPLSCDCQIQYFHSWLTSPSTPVPSSVSKSSSLCATPPSLTATPLASLESPPNCTHKGDYYEYYSEPIEGSVPTFLSSAELHLYSSSYTSSTGVLSLTWKVEEAALPYTCGQLHVFQDDVQNGPVLVFHQSLSCRSSTQSSPDMLLVSISLTQYQLNIDVPYIFCISLLQDASVIPGCSSALNLGDKEEFQVHSLEEQAILSHLQANVSLEGTKVNVQVESKVPPHLYSTCLLHLSLSSISSPPHILSSTSMNCSTSKHTFLHLSPNTYYNVCAALQVEEAHPAVPASALAVQGQCIISSAPKVRKTPKSIMPLLLTLVFLALGIACLTVLYMIVRRHREDKKQRMFLDPPSNWWRIRDRRRNQAFFIDQEEDDDF